MAAAFLNPSLSPSSSGVMAEAAFTKITSFGRDSFGTKW
jgi:hypothetical protein